MMRVYRRRLLLAGLAILSASATLSPAPASAQSAVKIGIVAPLTGPAAGSGIGLRQGMELAAKDWNDAGGVNIGGTKTPVELMFEDSQSRPEVGVSAAQKLINVDKIDVLIGEAFHSSVTMAIMELAGQFNLPILSGEPVSSEIAQKIKAEPAKYKYFWKGNFNSEVYASALSEMYKSIEPALRPGKKRMALIVEDTDFGRSNAELIASTFKADGWTVSALETVPLSHSDFYPQLTKLRIDEPDMVISIFTAVNSGVSFVKQYQELGLSSLHFGVYYPLRAEFIGQAGKTAEGLVWMPMMFDPSNADIAKFAKRVSDKYQTVASADHAFGHGIMNVALAAIDRAGSRDAAAISAGLAKTDYAGVYGRWVFDENHTAKAGADFLPMPAAQISSGKNVVIFPKNRAAAPFQAQPWTR